MFPEELKQNVPLGGGISHFVQSWEKLTKDQEISVRFLWEGNLYEFLCLCFGLEPPTRVFTKSPNIPFAQSKYQNFDLPGRHVFNVSINRETSSRKRHRNLSPSTFGICNKLKKSVMEPVRTVEYLGLVINSIQMTLSLT